MKFSVTNIPNPVETQILSLTITQDLSYNLAFAEMVVQYHFELGTVGTLDLLKDKMEMVLINSVYENQSYKYIMVTKKQYEIYGRVSVPVFEKCSLEKVANSLRIPS